MQILATNSRLVGATNESWQQVVKSAIRDSRSLLKELGIPIDSNKDSSQASQPIPNFPTFVPKTYLSRIEPFNPKDPLLRQVLSAPEELQDVPGFTDDPVGEHRRAVSAGILQKYAGRALLVTGGSCGVHCRYCFRRNYPYDQLPVSRDQWQDSLAVIEQDPTLEEVILSGGDPLMLVDSRLSWLINRLQEIPHVVRLRIHTRMPVVIPQRITSNLCEMLRRWPTPVTVVLHVNHPQEIDEHVERALCDLRRSAGCLLLNQAVLLAGVNDNLQALLSLSRRLYECGVLPYYLHQLDRVRGAAHFHVPVELGKELIERLRCLLPGYLVPHYVQEIAGEPAKSHLA